MITVTFDLYNENEYISSHEKTFDNEKEENDWFLAQMGHPYLSYSNIKEIKNENI